MNDISNKNVVWLPSAGNIFVKTKFGRYLGARGCGINLNRKSEGYMQPGVKAIKPAIVVVKKSKDKN